MYDNVMESIYQLVRLVQIVGIPLFASLFGIGCILLLTAGKNPVRKRRGLLFVIFFGIGTFLIAYIPAIVHTFAGEAPSQTANGQTVEEIVDRTVPVGGIIFNALKYVAIPITGTMFYIGLLVRLLAGKDPARKRLGIGLAMFSPLTMAVVLVIPLLLPKL
jgi:MFS family permease